MTRRAVSGLRLYRSLRKLRDRGVSELIRRDFGAWGAGTRVHPPIQVWGEDRIELGARVRIGEDSWLHALAPSGRISIGDGTRMSGHDVISAVESVVIGRSVLIARGVYIADHSHRFTEPGVPVVDQGVTDVRPVRIDDGAWLGHGVVVLPGVHIGAGAVIAANAVVRRDVPARTLVGGVPARVLREMDR